MSRPLRVVHVLPDLARGGGQVVVQHVVAHRRDDLVHHVVALGGGPMLADLQAVTEVTVLSTAARRDLPVAVQHLSSLLAHLGADVVHTNNTPLDKAVGAMAALRRRRPWVNSLNAIASSGDVRRPQEAAGPFVVRRVGNLANRALARGPLVAPAAMTAPSDVVRRSHCLALGLADAAIDLVPPGLPARAVAANAAVAELRRSLALDDAYPVLMSVGRVEPNKGQLDLVPMVAALATTLPGVKAVVVGGGEDLGELHRQVAAAGLGHRVRVLGERADVEALLQLGDVFVSTARHEGFGLAALEALAAGVPVVAYQGPTIAIGEFVEDGHGGALVAGPDVDALVRAVVALTRDPAHLATQSAAARAIGDRYTVAAQVDRLAATHRRAAGARDRSATERSHHGVSDHRHGKRASAAPIGHCER